MPVGTSFRNFVAFAMVERLPIVKPNSRGSKEDRIPNDDDSRS